MEFLNWFDWITPTNPYASLFFGILFTIIIGIMVWLESKRFKTVLVSIITDPMSGKAHPFRGGIKANHD